MIQTEQEKKELFREHKEFHKELDKRIEQAKTEERERCVKALEKEKYKDYDAIKVIKKLK